MHPFASAAVVLALVAAPVAFGPRAPQSPPQDPPSHRPGRFEEPREESARLGQGLIGAWQLVRAELPNYGISSGSTIGYALIMEGYLAFEFHLAPPQSSPDDPFYFQTGTQRWQMVGDQLETTGLIGCSNFTGDEDVTFEPPGERRRLRVLLNGDELTLVRDSSRFTFIRLGKLPYPGARPPTDFYGRPAPTDAGGEKPKKKD
jgi:hypothetical protein